jgi:DNA-binding transcriptional ArsR family regulator
MTAPARDLPHPLIGEVCLTDVLFALSDPQRLQIVRQLNTGPAAEVSCAAIGGEMPKSTRSHHLKLLREAGVIRSVARGRERMISLRQDELDLRFPGLLGAVLSADTTAHGRT